MRAQSGIGDLVRLKDDQWLARQKVAGKAVAECLRMAHDRISDQEPGLTGKVLEKDCVEILDKYDCIPTFKGYHGFPGAICYSVNKEMVHGVPNDKPLSPGDLVTVDLGATFEGAIADAAVTVGYGKISERHKDLLITCKNALDKAISSISIGKKIGIIGNAIFKETRNSGFSLVTHYGGHGISTNQPHSSPFVSNKSKSDDGITVYPGLTIAIEPMLIDAKTSKTFTKDDGWTVCGMGISAHFEHTVYITESEVKVITSYE